MLVRIPEPDRQPEYWEKVNAWLLANYGIEADPKRKNPKDLRFYAPDVDALYNPAAKVLTLLPPLPVIQSVIHTNNHSRCISGSYFSPIDDFNSRADVIQILTSNGWKIHSHHGSNIRVTRPGKRSGISANWNEELRKLYVFTSNSDLIQSDNKYPLSATDVFMQLNHIDCIALARQQQIRMGYGNTNQ